MARPWQPQNRTQLLCTTHVMRAAFFYRSPRSFTMSIFFRYLFAILVQMAWSRVGKGGPVPPIRLPGKGKDPVKLPLIGPWQMMVAMWMMNKFWDRYGRDVKLKLMDTSHPVARRVGSLLPGAAGKRATSGAPATITVPGTPASANNAAASSAAASTTTAPSASPAPSHDTQPLPTRRLPQGSVLSSLRGSS